MNKFTDKFKISSSKLLFNITIYRSECHSFEQKFSSEMSCYEKRNSLSTPILLEELVEKLYTAYHHDRLRIICDIHVDLIE